MKRGMPLLCILYTDDVTSFAVTIDGRIFDADLSFMLVSENNHGLRTIS